MEKMAVLLCFFRGIQFKLGFGKKKTTSTLKNVGERPGRGGSCHGWAGLQAPVSRPTMNAGRGGTCEVPIGKMDHSAMGACSGAREYARQKGNIES